MLNAHKPGRERVNIWAPPPATENDCVRPIKSTGCSCMKPTNVLGLCKLTRSRRGRTSLVLMMKVSTSEAVERPCILTGIGITGADWVLDGKSFCSISGRSSTMPLPSSSIMLIVSVAVGLIWGLESSASLLRGLNPSLSASTQNKLGDGKRWFILVRAWELADQCQMSISHRMFCWAPSANDSIRRSFLASGVWGFVGLGPVAGCVAA